jgi:hypothetical protein
MEKIGCKKSSQAEPMEVIVEHIFEYDTVCLSCNWFETCREAKEIYDEGGNNG